MIVNKKIGAESNLKNIHNGVSSYKIIQKDCNSRMDDSNKIYASDYRFELHSI